MANFGQALQTGLAGAGTGASIGGPWGAAAGGLLGFLSSLFGGEGQTKQFQNYTPEQQAALNQLLQQGLGESNFGNIENLARRGFQTQTIPSIAERFTAMGGGQRSSAFQGALGNAASGLESQLAGLRSQYGLQKLGLGLKPQFENAYFPRQPGALEQIAPQLLQLAALNSMGNNQSSYSVNPSQIGGLTQQLPSVPGLIPQLSGMSSLSNKLGGI